jgi:hypothetical protein
VTLLDSIKGPLADFVRALFPRYTYLGLYPAKVVAQNSDFTLELVPDESTLPGGVSNVPIENGLGPGVQVKVSAGARVLLGFRRGNPDEPFAALWESGTMTELVVTAATKVTVNAPQVLLGDGHAAPLRYGDAITLAPTGLTPLNAAGVPVTGVALVAPGTPVDVAASANPISTKVKA